MYALQAAIPHLTRSSLHRRLQRHDISRLPDVKGDAAPRRKFKTYPLGYFHIDIAEVHTDHRLTKPRHPWTNGQVERMNRTLKEATVKRFHHETRDHLRSHLADFVNAYNFGRRLKTLKGLTPHKAICKAWTDQPSRFNLDPLHQMPGLTIQ